MQAVTEVLLGVAGVLVVFTVVADVLAWFAARHDDERCEGPDRDDVPLSVHYRHGESADVVVCRPTDDYTLYPMLVIDHRVFVKPDFADPRERMTGEHVQFAWKLAEAASGYAIEIATAFERDHVAEFGDLPNEYCSCSYCTEAVWAILVPAESDGGEATSAA